MRFAIVDTETTGGRPGSDRLTEVGMILIEDGKVLAEFESLVNPERPIPPFVQNLTGITDAMVAEAPLFGEIAADLFALFEGSILVAHNAAFDFGFLRFEFEKAGFVFAPPRLCTVQVTRAAFPGYASYSLGKIAESLGISAWDAHRAMGDAKACGDLLLMALEKIGMESLLKLAKGYVEVASLPPGWTLARVAAIPSAPGVLRAYSSSGKVLWIGESSNLRDKVLEILRASGRKGPWAKIKSQMSDLDWSLTGSTRLAKVLAFQEILQSSPPLNRPLKVPPVPTLPQKDFEKLEAGRTVEEQAVLVVRKGVLKGYCWLDTSEGLTQEDLEYCLERLDLSANLLGVIF